MTTQAVLCNQCPSSLKFQVTGPARDSWIDRPDSGTGLVVWEGHFLLKVAVGTHKQVLG